MIHGGDTKQLSALANAGVNVGACEANRIESIRRSH